MYIDHGCLITHTGPPRGWEGPRANTKCGAHNIDCGRGSFEVLHALKCVLGASVAPFLCMHTVHTYLLKLSSSLIKQLQIEKYDVGALASGLRSSYVK